MGEPTPIRGTREHGGILKFFTPQAIDSWQDGDAYLAVREAYWQYLESLRPHLPAQLVELAKWNGIHDGLLSRVDHYRKERILRMIIRCGHSDMGCFNLELTYIGAEVTPEQDAALAKIARSVKSQFVYGCDLAFHELDVTPDGRIEHRLIFHAHEFFHPDAGGYLSFTAHCQELRWRALPRKSRRLPPMDDRYPGGPES